jgi:hypothetical protein
MERAIADLDRLESDLARQIDEVAADRRAYEVGFAEARIRYRTENSGRNPKVTVDEVNDYATVQTADERHHLTLSEETLRATNAARRAIESKLDTYRSMSAAIRGVGG